ncbi:MAG: monooxygenase, FAD-binding protein [Bacteroidetes bacterium]|nr:monooxygenase, FAD-binding protein [Bacteroidota bacterium]
MPTNQRITLVGAGLAGSLLSIYLAKRGYAVDVYERRPDMRKVDIGGGRSINLALSTRGIHALKDVGVYDRVMKIAIPMKGRMIHSVSGALTFQRYGKDDTEVIYATSRSQLNSALMDGAEQYPGVKLHFNQKCTGMNFDTGELRVFDEATGARTTLRTHNVIGTDGSASAIRVEMQRSRRFNLSQQYLDYGYKELIIPPGPDQTWQLEKHALHIWPRGAYMLIALPNIDGSFTCTFFYPFEGEQSFETLNTPERVHKFFKDQFPDVATLMPNLREEFFSNPVGSMVTVKCTPWHAGGRALLLGDAAHAIVPFFGQGMNCAFEDCTILDECLGGKGSGGGSQETGEAMWAAVFKEFEKQRKANTDAIADLAVENFVEMRDLVAQPKFQLKKKVEQVLLQRFPQSFIPKYSMVTFHRVPYSIAMTRGRTQDRILDELCSAIANPDELDWKKAEELIQTRLTPLYA